MKKNKFNNFKRKFERVPMIYKALTVIVVGLILVQGFSFTKSFVGSKFTSLDKIMTDNNEYIKTINTEVSQIHEDITYDFKALENEDPKSKEVLNGYYSDISTNLNNISSSISTSMDKEKLPEDRVESFKAIETTLSDISDRLEEKSMEMEEILTSENPNEVIQSEVLLNIAGFFAEEYVDMKTCLDALSQELEAENIAIETFSNEYQNEIIIK